MNVVPETVRNEIIALSKGGMGQRKICRTLGVSGHTVQRYAGKNPDRSAKFKEVRANMGTGRPEILDKRPGFCACGCGESTQVYTTGPLKGRWCKWKKGHASGGIKRRVIMIGRGCVTISQRKRYADDLRREMVAEFHRDRFQNRSEMLDKFSDRGFDRANLSRLFINGLTDKSRRINEDELPVPAPRAWYTPSKYSEPLERKFIPYEAKTDIKYLTRSGRFLCLDESPLDDGDTMHGIIGGYDADPLSILMEKEEYEAEQAKRDDLYSRSTDFRRWQEAAKPLQSLNVAFEGIQRIA